MKKKDGTAAGRKRKKGRRENWNFFFFLKEKRQWTFLFPPN
jgi:hypothetical protein